MTIQHNNMMNDNVRTHLYYACAFIILIRVYYHAKFFRRDVKTTETWSSLIRLKLMAVLFFEMVGFTIKIPLPDYTIVHNISFYVDKFGYSTTSSDVFAYFGVLCLYIGGFLLLYVHITMQKSWFWLVAEQKEQKLITHGPFQYVRHPMYSSVWLICVGIGMATSNILTIISGILMAHMATLRIPQEEETCIRLFGEQYKRYRKSCQYRILPYVY